MSEPGDLSRRTFVLGASATAAMNAVPMSFAGVPPDESTSLSAVDAVARMTRGDITVEGYASALLARCEALRSLNAFITLEPSRVLEVARACDRQRQSGTKLGPLFGLPIPIKDSVNTEDYPTTAGTEALRNFRPTADAPLVRRLRAAGAIVLGKTNLHEMSFGWTSNNLPFGAVHNPYDPTRIPGGSSGGTAAAVAARMAPLGIAEDTAGSIRVPAALCGISGFRPTTGRYSTQGVVPLTPVFDQVGPHARTVSDLGLFDSVIANDWRPLRPTPLKGLRLGIVRAYYFNGLHPEVERVTNLALQRIKEAGGELVETEFPDLVEESINLIRDQMISHDEIPTLTQYLKESGAHVTVDEVVKQASAEVQEDYRGVRPGESDFVSDASYATTRDTLLPALRRAYQDYFARTGVAAIVYPVTMVPATRIGDETDIDIRGRKISLDRALSRNITPSSTAGVPGLVLPAGLTRSGLPVALEFDAPSHADRRLLALGLSLELALGPIPPPNV